MYSYYSHYSNACCTYKGFSVLLFEITNLNQTQVACSVLYPYTSKDGEICLICLIIANLHFSV